MLSKTRVNFIRNLHQKKYRKEHGLFIAEGIKVVQELINSDSIVRQILFTNAFHEQHPGFLKNVHRQTECVSVTTKELEQISALTTSHDVMAVAMIPDVHFNLNSAANELMLMLDGISDPGNLGTIIRIADWFGISQLICSRDTVDAYNPKVVQATMGSLFRTKLHYLDLNEVLSSNAATIKAPVYGTLLEGENIYKATLKNHGFILLGNESKGIDTALQQYVTSALTIPAGEQNKTSHPDSLNVAVSAAIVCSEFNRRLS